MTYPKSGIERAYEMAFEGFKVDLKKLRKDIKVEGENDKPQSSWTDTPPTQPGWYWWRSGPDDDSPTPISVYRKNGEMYGLDAFDGYTSGELIVREEWEGQWAGPIEPPDS